MQGLGEGVAMPSMNNLVSRFVPLAAKATAIGLIFLGFNCGMNDHLGNFGFVDLRVRGVGCQSRLKPNLN